MDFSIIVPTYNRREDVRQTLLSLAEQSYPAWQYEVVVADDGSTDGTGEMVKSLELPYHLAYAWQPNKGRCAARNLGLSRARGDLILFLDGDMTAGPDLVAEHARSHGEHGRVLVRGAIHLAPELLATPFMRYGMAVLDDVSALLDEDGFLPFSQALTGNLSIRRRDLDEVGGFDEALDAGYAWDDTDLGYRAQKAGLRLIYNPTALSYHHDRVTSLEQQCERFWLASKTIPLLFAKHPELRGQIQRYVDKEPIALGEDSLQLVVRKVIRRVLATTPFLCSLKLVVHGLEKFYPSSGLLYRCYWLILGSYVLKGYRTGLRSVID